MERNYLKQAVPKDNEPTNAECDNARECLGIRVLLYVPESRQTVHLIAAR